MSNLYYNPEKFGLTVVYRRDLDGRLVYVEDSGCSCPSPFEGKGMPDLTLCTPAELQAHLEKRQAEHVSDYCEPGDYRAAEIADLMLKVTK